MRGAVAVSYALIVDEHSYVRSHGCPPSCENCGGWCERDSYGISVSPRALHKDRRDFPLTGYEEVEGTEIAPGETAYVVIVTYTDGDTFGYSGYWACLGVFTTAESADETRKEAEKPNEYPFDKGYRPWDGYFASLESADVYPMTVLV